MDRFMKGYFDAWSRVLDLELLGAFCAGITPIFIFVALVFCFGYFWDRATARKEG